MKKLFATILTFAALSAATTVMAGNVVTETYPIKSDYTAISVTNMIEVVLVDAPKNSIRVEADERLMPYLQIVVKNGVLVLNFDDQREVAQPWQQPCQYHVSDPWDWRRQLHCANLRVQWPVPVR